MSNDIPDDDFFSCSSTSSSFLSAASSDSSPLNLGDQISSLFSQYPNNLNIAHINAQSVPRHYSDLLASINCAHLDALLISESFLKPSLPSVHYSLPGFVLIRNDRTGKGGGGVAMYLRAGIPYKIISASPSAYSGSAEHLFLEITLHQVRMLLGVIYSPNLTIDYFDSLDSLFNNFCPTYDHVVLMGDFNTCLLKNNSRTHKLQSLTSSFNLSILPLSATHHFPNCSPSLLDLMIVSKPNNVSVHGQLTACFSYHDLIFMSYKIRPPKRKPQYIHLRNYKGIDLEALLRDAVGIDWTEVYQSSSVDDMVKIFNNKVLNLYDRYAPTRRVKIKYVPAPWLTPAIKDAMASRDRAKRRLKRCPSEHNQFLYKEQRNRCSRMCRDAKRRYFHNSLDNRNSSEVWKFLKTVGIGKSPVVSGKDTDVCALNKHFSLPPVTIDPHVKSVTLNKLSSLPMPQCSPFEFCPVSESDVKKSIQAISSSAVGNDNVCSRMISPILPVILPVLTHIFNFSLFSCAVPGAWKQAHIIPLPKIPNPASLTDFRPISILPFLSKVLEHIVHQQLSRFLSSNDLLSPFQSGFRPGHSTVTALLKVTDDIRWAMDHKSLTLLVLLDFSSAFNSVDFEILLGILKSLNFSSSTIRWFDSYLHGRSQRVRLDEFSSDWCSLTAGVPQGGVLSPLLFSIFINSVTRVISSNFHLYADDLQLYHHFRGEDAEAAVSAVNSDLELIGEWSRSFGLQINPKKSQAMIIGGRYMRNKLDIASLSPLWLNGVKIEYVDTAKNLGVIMDSHLSWSAHVAEVSRKVHYTFHSLKCLQSFLPLKTKISLAQTLIQPIIDYADACYLDATEELLNKLERLQNICIRFAFNLKKYDHVSGFRKMLKWLPIRFRRNSRILSLLFNILHNPKTPSYLRERFSFSHPSDALCRSHLKNLLKSPPHSTDFYSYSFTAHAVRLWNALPPDIRGCQTLSIFKSRVKEHYLSLPS
ncbi:hypothetical protein PYW08_014300 [Mythimna loreyi]|uniref:Uncharacterized protein n=1 Tax=Mythimna loreyi TaxID=667449 RepID=A0ACC2RBH0_9NEOP|nr:hypothetical protein PYW08_014300 [Mythimna loreyi]